jgi:hypothetical protein
MANLPVGGAEHRIRSRAWLAVGAVVIGVVTWRWVAHTGANAPRADSPRLRSVTSLPLGMKVPHGVELRSQPFPQLSSSDTRWLVWFSMPTAPLEAWDSLARAARDIDVPLPGSADSCRLVGRVKDSFGEYRLGARVPTVVGLTCGGIGVGQLNDGSWASATATLDIRPGGSEFSLDLASLAPGGHEARSTGYPHGRVPIGRLRSGSDSRVDGLAEPRADLRPGDRLPGDGGCLNSLGAHLHVPPRTRSIVETGSQDTVLAAASGRAALNDLADQINHAGGVRPAVRHVRARSGQWIWILRSRISSDLCEAQTDPSDRFIHVFTATD